MGRPSPSRCGRPDVNYGLNESPRLHSRASPCLRPRASRCARSGSDRPRPRCRLCRCGATAPSPFRAAAVLIRVDHAGARHPIALAQVHDHQAKRLGVIPDDGCQNPLIALRFPAVLETRTLHHRTRVTRMQGNPAVRLRRPWVGLKGHALDIVCACPAKALRLVDRTPRRRSCATRAPSSNVASSVACANSREATNGAAIQPGARRAAPLATRVAA